MHMVRTAFVYTCSWLGGKSAYIYSFGILGQGWMMSNGQLQLYYVQL